VTWQKMQQSGGRTEILDPGIAPDELDAVGGQAQRPAHAVVRLKDECYRVLIATTPNHGRQV